MLKLNGFSSKISIILNKISSPPLTTSARFVYTKHDLSKVLKCQERADCCCLAKRTSHSDLPKPDFDKYRRPSTEEPDDCSSESSYHRRISSYMPVAVMFTAGMYAAKTAGTMFLTSMNPSADVLAMAQLELKLNNIAPGQMLTTKWRGKPLFVRHRLPEEWNKERAVPLSMLRDPEKDEDRTKKPEWLVVIGVCTHLGCVPISNAGDYNAFYCPCHGSHYDYSGRIRKGPAPTNLEVPKYEFVSENEILVG